MSDSLNKDHAPKFVWGAGDIRILKAAPKGKAKNPYRHQEEPLRKNLANMMGKILAEQYDRVRRHLEGG